MNFDAAALAYVRYVLQDKNLKPGALAREAGISASTLTRALNDPNHKFKLSMTTLEKIAEYSGINLAPFLEAKTTADLTLDSAHREDFYKPGHDAAGSGGGFKVTLIIGDVAAGRWIEPSPFNYFDYGALFLTSSNREPRDCFAYVVRDDSANMFADNRDILFCTKIEEQKVEEYHTKPNQHYGEGPVIVERRSKDAFKIELTARLIRRRRDGVPGWELLSGRREDHDPDRKSRPRIPRVFLDKYGGNDEIKVIGQVENVIRGDTHEALNAILFDIP
jgi:transcriptional regulator with XRE-family HTH domain